MADNPQRRAENLAFCFQEVLTVAERLRVSRQPVQDSDTFRIQIREALSGAEKDASRRGYTGEDIQLAVFAVVAFLDESILNLRSKVFADWVRRPLQEELFGHQIAGEIFFQHVRKLLARDESHATADLLEVYYLCMLLGFAGKYGLAGRGDLKGIMDSTGDKIRRIRQLPPEISPRGTLPAEGRRQSAGDPWVRRLMFSAAACLLLAMVLFGIYKWSLGSGISRMDALAQTQS